MCGIAGFISRLPESSLQDMSARLIHRGPDDEGTFYAPVGKEDLRIGLAHRRLSIIDLEGGHQPMVDESGTYALIFNGEIYNYRELRSDLAKRGHSFRTQSDTEVILRGYVEHGSKILDLLEGMFAFALWDGRHRSLILARDRLGIKPLYYYERQSANELYFASEMKAFLSVVKDGEGLRIHRPALYHYLLHGFPERAQTLFVGVRQLRPGHFLCWKNGEVKEYQYWKPQVRTEGQWAERQWHERLREVFASAVKSHLVSDVPIGLALSGGLDSSVVLATMSRFVPLNSVHSFTLGYNLPDDEIPFARIHTEKYPVNHHVHVTPLQGCATHLEKILYHLEEPIAHPVLGTTYFLSQFISRQSKVVLIGEGSDELFCGYPHFRLFTPPFRLLPARMWRQLYEDVIRLLPRGNQLIELLHPDWVNREEIEYAEHAYDHYFEGRSNEEAVQLRELETKLVESQLLRVDKLTMAHSIEARVPFLDRQFVELALSIPFSMKVSRKGSKYVFRQAMAPLLTPEIAARPKSGKRGTQALLKPLVREVFDEKLRELVTGPLPDHTGFFNKKALRKYLYGMGRGLHSVHPIEKRKRWKLALATLILDEWAKIFLERRHA